MKDPRALKDLTMHFLTALGGESVLVAARSSVPHEALIGTLALLEWQSSGMSPTPYHKKRLPSQDPII